MNGPPRVPVIATGSNAMTIGMSHSTRSVLPTILGATVCLSVFGGVAIRGISLSAAASAAIAAGFTIAAIRRDMIASPAVVKAAGSFFAILAIMAASSLGHPILVGGLQQAVVWAGSALAIIYAYNQRHLISTERLSIDVTKSLERATFILIATTAFSRSVYPIPGASPRVAALGALVSLCWFVANWTGWRGRAGIESLIVALFIFITLSRTATLVAILIIVFGRSTSRRLASTAVLVRAGLFVAICFIAISQYQPLRDRFFSGDTTISVGGLNINGMGRAGVWKGLWVEAWRDPLTGHGLGSARTATQAISPTIEHPHQEYLRLFFEGGLISLGLFFGGLVASWKGFSKQSRETSDTSCQIFAHAGKLMIIVVVLTSATDNTLVYPFMMIPFGLFSGVALRRLPRP